MLSCGRSRDSFSHTLNVPTNGGLRQLGAIGSGKPRLTIFPFLVRIFPAGEEGWAITAPGLNFVTLRFVCVRFAAIALLLGSWRSRGLSRSNWLSWRKQTSVLSYRKVHWLAWDSRRCWLGALRSLDIRGLSCRTRPSRRWGS